MWVSGNVARRRPSLHSVSSFGPVSGGLFRPTGPHFDRHHASQRGDLPMKLIRLTAAAALAALASSAVFAESMPPAPTPKGTHLGNVIVNPYGFSPLTAVINRNTKHPTDIRVTVKGKPEGGVDINFTTSAVTPLPERRHSGLRPLSRLPQHGRRELQARRQGDHGHLQHRDARAHDALHGQPQHHRAPAPQGHETRYGLPRPSHISSTLAPVRPKAPK